MILTRNNSLREQDKDTQYNQTTRCNWWEWCVGGDDGLDNRGLSVMLLMSCKYSSSSSIPYAPPCRACASSVYEIPPCTFYHARLAVDHTLVYRFLMSFILFPLITTVDGLTFACLIPRVPWKIPLSLFFRCGYLNSIFSTMPKKGRIAYSFFGNWSYVPQCLFGHASTLGVLAPLMGHNICYYFCCSDVNVKEKDDTE